MKIKIYLWEKMKTRIDTAAILWLGLVLLIALSIAFLLPVTPQDYWWYLRIGHDTLASGAVPRLESMTFTRAGTPVDYQSWGAAVLFWLVYRLGGLPLTVLLRGVFLAATYIAGLGNRPPGRGGPVGSQPGPAGGRADLQQQLVDPPAVVGLSAFCAGALHTV